MQAPPSFARRIARRVLPHAVRVELVRMRRLPAMAVERPFVARRRSDEGRTFGAVVTEHRSPMTRPGLEPPTYLRAGRRRNVETVAGRIDGVVIEPGQTFSYHHLVGRPSLLRGFRFGLELHRERESAGVGGGACKVSNLLYWLALNAGLDIVERHRHSLDLYPDRGRTVPFGCGATVFYTMADLRFRNPHAVPVRVELEVDDADDLVGRISAPRALDRTWRIEEHDHRFECIDGVWWRSNRIVRTTFDTFERTIARETIAENRARTCYIPRPQLGTDAAAGDAE